MSFFATSPNESPSAILPKLFQHTSLTPPVRSHLKRVYTALAACVFLAAAGVYAHLTYNIGGLLSGLVALGLVFYLASNSTTASPQNRLYALMALGFFKGASIGPLVGMAHPELVMTAFLGASTVFVCFSLAALVAERKSYLFLGGMLSSAVSLLLVLSLLSLFTRSPLMHSASLYLGLVVFCGYVLFDTQVILERALQGHSDYVMDAVRLFTNFVAIFVRILIILMKNSQQKQNNKKRTR